MLRRLCVCVCEGVLVSADRDWDTHFHWARVGESSSLITLQWFIPSDALTVPSQSSLHLPSSLPPSLSHLIVYFAL